jgi:hypothetical protein
MLAPRLLALLGIVVACAMCGEPSLSRSLCSQTVLCSFAAVVVAALALLSVFLLSDIGASILCTLLLATLLMSLCETQPR